MGPLTEGWEAVTARGRGWGGFWVRANLGKDAEEGGTRRRRSLRGAGWGCGRQEMKRKKHRAEKAGEVLWTGGLLLFILEEKTFRGRLYKTLDAPLRGQAESPAGGRGM